LSTKLGWLIYKDLVSECRSRQLGTETFLLGTLVAVVFSLQIDLPAEEQRRAAGTLVWFAILFAGLPALERSFASEREDGCLDGLLLSPVTPASVYLAKLAVNAIVLSASAALLIPLWAVLSGVPLLMFTVRITAVALLGCLGIAAVGTLLSSVAGGSARRRGGLALLVLPLVIPVLVAAAESTRLLLENDLGREWWRWVLFLAAFATTFVTAGTVLFEFAVQD
jgi:heme exporter protein B